MVPCSSSQAVDKSRIKTKDVYEGIYKASFWCKLYARMGADKFVQVSWNTCQDARWAEFCMHACIHKPATQPLYRHIAMAADIPLLCEQSSMCMH